jgi:hypothetical protein
LCLQAQDNVESLIFYLEMVPKGQKSVI